MFPKVYLNPGELWIKEQEQLIGTMITAGTFRNLEGKKVETIGENVGENVKYHAYENSLLIKEYVEGQTVFYEVVSKVEYKEKSVTVDKPKENKVLDTFQFVLDIAGLVPVVGEVADGANGIIYSVRGDATNAALSFGAMIPVAGWASTGGKFAVKGKDLYQVRNVVSTEHVTSIYSPIYQDVIGSSLGKTQNQLDLLATNYYRTGTDAFAFNMPFAKMDIPTSIRSGDVKAEIKNVDVGAKGIGNASVPTKPGGGSEPKDFVKPHSEKHMYDPSRPSTPNRSQYGEDVDVDKLRQETMTNPDKAYSNWPNPNNPNPNKITKYYKEFDGNISTPDTPTGSHRVFENLGDPTRSSHFPYVPRK
ncbi:hypothetical protein MKY34_17960 [Sporosarcina sp. FSL K6-1522]|uniref:hypothetical protein n=1 Tax=Sporosarcina sp. FSL K6-1522 TaxID=2921554 RepID=UPI00315B030F